MSWPHGALQDDENIDVRGLVAGPTGMGAINIKSFQPRAIEGLETPAENAEDVLNFV
jgi:hypothetical protein